MEKIPNIHAGVVVSRMEELELTIRSCKKSLAYLSPEDSNYSFFAQQLIQADIRYAELHLLISRQNNLEGKVR